MNEADDRAVLVVEDSDDDFDTVLAAARLGRVGNPLLRAIDADSAEAMLMQPPPGGYAFMLLDCNLPGRDGLSLLRQMRREPAPSALPVVVFTSSANPRDRQAFDAAGANSYHVKPLQYPDGLRTLQAIFERWLVTP